jgi:hypothetical protein
VILWFLTTSAVILAAYWAGTWRRWAAGAVLTAAGLVGLLVAFVKARRS